MEILKRPRGIFVFIDDDKDEHLLLKIAMKGLKLENQVVSLYNGVEAFNYLKGTDDEIFLILCDINMPKMDGLALKRAIDETPELKVKAIPFFFHSNTASPAEVRTAYSMSIQGYLRKALDTNATARSLANIINLCTDFIHPKDLDPHINIGNVLEKKSG